MANSSGKEPSFGLAALAIAAWSVVLLTAFLAHRASDAGRLGELVGTLVVGPLAGTGFFYSLMGIVVSMAILVAWLGLGGMAIRLIPAAKGLTNSHLLELVVQVSAGAAAWSLVWMLLGSAGLYTSTAAIVAAFAGWSLLPLSLGRLREAKLESRVPEKTVLFDKALLFLIAVPVVLAFVSSLAPPTAKDTLLYHFALPKAFIAQGSSDFIEGNIASYLALGTEMHVVWAMLLGNVSGLRAGEAAAGAVVWMFFPLLLAATFGFAREIGIERRWALIAVLMGATVPSAYHVAASAYIDISLALFVTLAIYALTRWWKTLETGWLVYVAIFLGAALSAKLTTLFVIAAFALIVLLRGRADAIARQPGSVAMSFMTPGRILLRGFGALMLAGVIASPWYLRTWAETGSPLFPFYLSIWPGEAPGWDLERSNLLQAMNAQYGGYVKTPLDYVLVPWNVSVAAQPELATHFDGVLGVAFLIGLPLLAWALWKFEMPVEVKIGTGVAAVVFLFWMFSSQQLRYLLPILPSFAIGIAASFERIGKAVNGVKPVGQAALIAAAAAGLITGTAWFLQKAPLRVVLGGEGRDEYLARNLDHYPYYLWLNRETAPDARVWLINMRRDTYHLERPYFSDYLFEDITLQRFVRESRSAPELKAKGASLGVQFVLARHDFLFDYERSTLVDDTRPRAENEAKLKMAREFILDSGRTIMADRKFSLIQIYR